MRFTYYGGFKRFFALLPHTCWVCLATFWLEQGYRRPNRKRFFDSDDYRCQECFPVVRPVVREETGV